MKSAHASKFMPDKINGNFRGKDIISLDQFDRKSLEKLFSVTDKVKPIGEKGLADDRLKGKIVTLLFYEPSSRTLGSFDAATKQLGGQTIINVNPQEFSSVAKGETFEDTIRVFEAYGDAIVLRSPQIGDSTRAAKAAEHVPIINAGDGIGEHPTQAILDMYTIREAKGKLEGLRGVVAGDLLHGRTVHSLIKGLSFYSGNEIFLLSPDKLKLSNDDMDSFSNRGVKLTEIKSMAEIPKDCDFWYWTRVQKERFKTEEEYKAVNNQFIITPEVMDNYAGLETVLMHPLPRVGEISEKVDSDPRALYLTKQMRNGMYTRMALLGLVLGKL